MRENFTYGSVRGAAGDGSPYRDSTTKKGRAFDPLHKVPLDRSIQFQRTTVASTGQIEESPNANWHGIARFVAAIWLIGVLLLLLRPALGFAHAGRLRKVGRVDVAQSTRKLSQRVAEAMNVLGVVRVAQSSLAQAPCVVGWSRPVILLPTSAVTGLTTAELESILAHELAHIRRHDYLVNLVQMAIETLLFFHPVMWWVSRCVRREREYCCDDLALQVCGDRGVLTDALLVVGGVKTRPQLAIASDGTVLFARVERILKPRESANGTALRKHRDRRQSGIAVCVALLAIGAAVFVFSDDETETNNPKEEPVMASEPNKSDSENAGSPITEPDVQRWSDAMNDRDLDAIAALLKEDSKFATMEFVPREKLPFYHMATYKPTHYANMQNDLELMETLLKGGVAPSFGFAVESVEMARLIIRYGGRLDMWDTLDYTPVITACWFPNAELMQVLLEAGADPNYAKQNSGATGLMILAERADDGDEAIEIARLLIKHGADVNQKAFSGFDDQPVTWDAYSHDVSQGHETALHWAASYGKSEYAKFLIDQGADTNAKTISIHRGGKNADDSLTFEPFAGETPLDWAFKGGDEKTIRLLGGGDSLETVAGAARAGLKERVDALLAAGGDANDVDPSTGKYAVELALRNNRIEVLRSLIDAGAEWRADIITAVRKGFPLVVRKALAADSALKQKLTGEPERLLLDEKNLKKPHVEAIRAIIEAEPSLPTDFVLASYIADADAARSVIAKHDEAIAVSLRQVPSLAGYAVCDAELLTQVLDVGADVNARGLPFDSTPLHKAIMHNRGESLSVLLQRGADVEARLHPVWRPLDMAISSRWTDDFSMLKPLLDAGANPNVIHHNGYTDLDLVTHRDSDRTDEQYEQAIAWLRAAGAKTSAEIQTEKRQMAQSFLPPDHPFIVAVREVDLPRVKELVAEDRSLVNAQVQSDIELTGKAWKDGKHVAIGEDDSHNAGALHFAAFHGHSELAQLLIDLGADVTLPADFGEERDSGPVGIAAWQGDAATLKVLLDAAKAAQVDLDLTPKLHSALVHSAWDKVDLLLEYGAEHDFYTAAMAGDAEVLKRLIDADAESIDRKHSRFDGTPLEEALKVGRLESAELLAEHGAKVSTEAAAALGRIEEIRSVLDDDPEAATRLFGTQPLLLWAIQGGQVEVVKLLLERGANPNGGDEWGVTPLRQVADVKGEPGEKIVDLLVEAGADLYKKSRSYTPIECAKSQKNKHVTHRISYYIDNDIEVTEPQAKFWKAVGDGDIKTVKACLEGDSSLASMRFPSDRLYFLTHGFPLRVAADNGDWDMAQLLLEHGADPDAKRDLEDARALEREPEHLELGMPIIAAYNQGNYEMVHMLLDKGASVHAHPYCAHPFASVVCRDATAAGAPTSMVLRSIPDLDEEDKKKIAPVPDDAPEVVKLYDRILSLGGIPDHGAIAQAGDYETVELLLKKHAAGASIDHWGDTVHTALLYGSAWRGNAQTVEMCMTICANRHTTYMAQHCIRNAITSHNRPGTFDEYYRVIELNLDYLKAHEAFDKHDMFTPLQCLVDGYIKEETYGPCPEPPTVEQKLRLAKLCLDKGVDVNHVTPTYCKYTALDLAILHGHKEYAEFLRANGGRTTPAGEKLIEEKEANEASAAQSASLLPPGSYQRSSRNERVERDADGKDWLIAECRKVDGTWIESRLQLTATGIPIHNSNGRLEYEQGASVREEAGTPMGAVFTNWERVDAPALITDEFDIGNGFSSVRRRIVIDTLEVVFYVQAGTTTVWGTGDVILHVPMPNGYEANLDIFCETQWEPRWLAGTANTWSHDTHLAQMSHITVAAIRSNLLARYISHGLRKTGFTTMADLELKGPYGQTRGQFSIPIRRAT